MSSPLSASGAHAVQRYRPSSAGDDGGPLIRWPTAVGPVRRPQLRGGDPVPNRTGVGARRRDRHKASTIPLTAGEGPLPRREPTFATDKDRHSQVAGFDRGRRKGMPQADRSPTFVRTPCRYRRPHTSIEWERFCSYGDRLPSYCPARRPLSAYGTEAASVARLKRRK
jgi:hypothetical protein